MGREVLERFATRTLAGARMLTTSKPRGNWRRPVVATGLVLLLAGCTPPGPRALLEGERLIREGRSEDAIRRLRTAVEFLPGNAQAWNHLALAYHGAKRPTEASEAYQQALRLDRNLSVAYFNSGCLYLEHGEPMLATDALWAYVGLQPRVVEGWVKLGQAQLRTRKWDQAERSFAEALRLNPARVDALNGLGVALHQRRKVREAWQSFTNAVMREPGFAPAWMNLGVIAHQTGASAKAAQAYRQYANLRPELARQMDLAEVIGKLEAPPAAPVIQLPPAPGTTQDNTPPVPDPASPSGASVEPGTSESATLPSGSVASTDPPMTNETVQASPPQVPELSETEPTLAEGASTNAVEVPVLQVAVDEGSVTQEVAAATVAAPTSTDTPPAAVSVPISVVSNPPLPATAQEVSGAAPAETADALVLPTPPPADASASVPTGVVAAAPSVPVVPVDRVQLPGNDSLVMGVRDEEPLVGASGASGAVPAEDGLAPLVRPVGAQRSSPGTDRDDRRGFWSRANPVSWFGSEGSKSEGSTEGSVSASDRDSGAAGWRWVNPASWFRGTGEGGAATATASSDRPAALDSGRGEATNQVAALPPAALVPERGSTGGVEVVQVRRAPTATWASRPVSTRPEPVRERGVEMEREIRRYAYLRPERPAEGNRNAAKGVLAQAQEEHRRDRASAAVRLYEEALELDPSLAEAYQELAVAALQLDDVPRALVAGEMGLLLQPQTVVARLNFALALDRAGYPLDAAMEAERVLGSNPDHVAAHLLLGNLNAQKLGRPDLARVHYLRVLDLEPTHPQNAAIRRWLAGRP
jgi:tetratricopeptide (TPR) repeat protein